MLRIVFSCLLGIIGILISSLPSAVHGEELAERGDIRQGTFINRQRNGVTGNQSLRFDNRTDRDLRRSLDRYRDNTTRYGTYGSYYYGPYGYPSVYSSYYDVYGYPSSSYSSYSTYPIYPNPYANPYLYPGYGAYYNPYYNPGMYNPNTVFVNPPSSMNFPTGYPTYSETYMYR